MRSIARHVRKLDGNRCSLATDSNPNSLATERGYKELGLKAWNLKPCFSGVQSSSTLGGGLWAQKCILVRSFRLNPLPMGSGQASLRCACACVHAIIIGTVGTNRGASWLLLGKFCEAIFRRLVLEMSKMKYLWKYLNSTVLKNNANIAKTIG